MRKRRYTGVTLLLATLVAGSVACASPAAERHTQDELHLPVVETVAVAAPEARRQERPDSLVDTISIEGMPEPMVLRLYAPPGGFPLPFSTYVPSDVEVQTVAAGEGDAVRFVPAFGGRRVEDAVLSLHVPAGAPDAAAVQRLVAAIAASHGEAERVASGGYTWALEEYRFRSRQVAGGVALGRQGSTYFVLLVAHPPEYGDGFGPRVARILADWRWADGSRLGS